MQRSAASNSYTIRNRGENLFRIFPGYFDKVLLDAPCSALGTLASNRQVHHWWSADKLERIGKIQYQLMVSALKSLKTGGILVYSTCSVAPEENELLIEKICHKFPVEIKEIDQPFTGRFSNGWTAYRDSRFQPEMTRAIRIWPHLHQLEGFFVVKLQKTADIETKISTGQDQWNETLPADHAGVREILQNIEERWGIGRDHFNANRFLLTRNRIWMLSSAVLKVPHSNFISGGLLLAEKRLSGWKLVSNSAQILSDYIENHRLPLREQELKILFKDGHLPYADLCEDYYALSFRDQVIGVVYHDNGILRLRLPHSFDLAI
jgi:hypothetical protein